MSKSGVITLFTLIIFTLTGCVSTVGGLQSYLDDNDGYEVLYPSGWVQVDVKDATEGVDVVFRDLIERSENLSVIISEIPQPKPLEELGTPTEVGYRFLKKINENPALNRKAELINAESRQTDKQTYYNLEYQVKLPNNQERHSLTSIAVSHGKLYTLSVSTVQRRWQKVKPLFETIVNAFSVY